MFLVAITLLTVASFYLNAVFAFAISQPGQVGNSTAFRLGRHNLVVVLGIGAVVGVALGVSAIVVTRWGTFWFTLSLGIVIGVMMLTYVTVPARIAGIRARWLSGGRTGSGGDRRDAWSAHLHAAVRNRTDRHPPARVAAPPLRTRGRASRGGLTLAGRRDRRREGDQDEREARRGQAAPPEGTSAAE